MVVDDVDITPSRGKSTIGSKAVTAMGVASVIHLVVIRTATAATFIAAGGIPEGKGDSKIMASRRGPRINPIFCLVAGKGMLISDQSRGDSARPRS